MDVGLDIINSVRVIVRYAGLFRINGIPVVEIILVGLFADWAISLFWGLVRVINPGIRPGVTAGGPFTSEAERVEFSEYFQGEDQGWR